MHAHTATQSGTLTTRKHKVLQQEVVTDPLTDPPPYGAQHRQDALWEGGNKALPPLWQEFKVLQDKTRYVDNNIHLGSWNRPLPGVRLDQPGDLVPGCEWHISSLGRSYFVNHNTRTTTWKKPTLGRSVGSLAPERVIEGHSGAIWDLACLSTGYITVSSSVDGLIRQWTTGGRPGGKSWDSGEAVGSIAVSPDDTMVVSGSAVDGRIRLWSIKEGSVIGYPWEGHTAVVRCLDWSPSALEIASGSEDGTVRRWNPDTGRQVIPAIETGHGWVFVVKYSPQGDKLASCGMDKMIRVWSKDGKPLIKIKGHTDSVTSFCWSKDGTNIFSGSASSDCTIRKWRLMDGEERLVLQGHSNTVTSLCLSPNESYLVSTSRDCSIRIWDLKSNQPVGDPLLHDDEICTLAMSPDGRYTFSAGVDGKVYIWNMEVVLGGTQAVSDGNTGADMILKARGRTVPLTNANSTRGGDFWENVPNHTPRRPSSPIGPSPPSHQRSLFGFWDLVQPWRWNFKLSRNRPSEHAVNVALARDDDRYGIAPPSEAEVTAAMRPTSDDRSAQENQVSGARGSQACIHGKPKQTTAQCCSSDAGTGDISYVTGCCGFYLVRHRRSSLN